jgi:hypothetical protein
MEIMLGVKDMAKDMTFGVPSAAQSVMIGRDTL